MKKRYCIFIVSYSGKTKLYWNRILQAWTENIGSASPFTEDEVKNSLPFAAKYEDFPEVI